MLSFTLFNGSFLQVHLVKCTLTGKNRVAALEKERLNVAKPGGKTGALMPLHTVCGMGTILLSLARLPQTERFCTRLLLLAPLF